MRCSLHEIDRHHVIATTVAADRDEALEWFSEKLRLMLTFEGDLHARPISPRRMGGDPAPYGAHFKPKFGELCCQAFDGINRILVGRIGSTPSQCRSTFKRCAIRPATRRVNRFPQLE